MEPREMEPHIVPIRTYAMVFAALLVGTALTVQIAFIDLGPFNTIVALGIATSKAVLVALFFMHLKYGPRLTRLVVVSGIYWWLILLVLTFADYWTRSWRTYG
jgi:cytochrome c oxidase subunit 4